MGAGVGHDGAVPRPEVLNRAPLWFTAALAARPAVGEVTVEGCPIRYLRWREPGGSDDGERPGVVLIHGGAAHAHWWSPLAPLLLPAYDVVALDLSGHGDSGRRPAYSRHIWAAEVMAVIDDVGWGLPPVLVGHSMGGFVSIVAAADHGDRLAGAIICDSPVRRPDPESEAAARGRVFRNPRVYPDAASALARFRLVPDQPCENGYLVDHIALHSLRRTPRGWTWKFDPAVFGSTPGSVHEHLASVRCRVALLRGERSELVTPDVSDHMYELLGRNAPVVAIPEARHHLMLDQPLAFIAAVRALLADWEHSVPRRPTR